MTVAGSSSLLERVRNRHRRESPPLAKSLFAKSVCKADLMCTEVTEINRSTPKVLRSRSFACFNPLYALPTVYISFRTKQKHWILIPSPGRERTALHMLCLATTSKNSLAPSS